nr:prolyl oligopeptidase family serine peptidase [Clostridiales bacterium]
PTDLENEFYYFENENVSRVVGTEYFCDVIGKGVKHTISPEDLDFARPALKKYSPVRFVDKNVVPTYFGHGEQDGVVPYQNALDLDAVLTEHGVLHEFISFPNSGHGCEDKVSMKKIMEFFFDCAEKYLK